MTTRTLYPTRKEGPKQKRAAPLERHVQRACIDWLRLKGIVAWRVNQQGVPLHNGPGGFRPGPSRGMADILGIIPTSGHVHGPGAEPYPLIGRFLAVECKRPLASSRTTASQEAFLEQVRRAGGVAIVARSTADLEAVLGPLLRVVRRT